MLRVTVPASEPTERHERELMNKSHKGHNIFISASRSGLRPQWKPSVRVIWSEDGQGKVNALDINATFQRREEAETAGFAFAKNWIDIGKPDQ
jgi:hypothetical protein